MSDHVFEAYYRSIYADLSVDREESEEVKSKFMEANPPPDKLIWLRAAAFRIGTEYLSDERDSNVSLLRCINAIVHALEVSCMEPSSATVEVDEGTFDETTVTDHLREIFADLSVDTDESTELISFLKGEETAPPKSKLVWIRAAAFRIGSEFLSDDKDLNVKLLKSINAVVHCIEKTCLRPKAYSLKVDPPQSISINAIGMDASISAAAQYLWDLDVNRLTPNKDYIINVQKGKKPYHHADINKDPLFSFVDQTVFQRPTYKSFIALLDNYNAETGIAESVSRQERNENWTFLRAIMQTAPMQFMHKYCHSNNPDLVPSDSKSFLELLYRIWFDLYFRDRSDDPDSSGFEHVFVGEVKHGKVSGFHNWIFFYLQEKKGNLNYKGYIKPRSKISSPAETNDDDHVLSVQFDWKGVEKFVGSSFIGVSPEFEMALYTMCFLVGKSDNLIDIDTGTDQFELNVKVHSHRNKHIGSSYIETLAHYD